MAGSRRKRQRRRPRPPSPQAEPSPTELTALGQREVSVAERPFKKTCHSSVSTSSTIWQLGDPSKRTLSLRGSAPQNTPNRMRYLGCSYGYLIFSYYENCLLVDMYTGAKAPYHALAPQLSMQEVGVVWGEEMFVGVHFKPWLVISGDMLLMLDLSVGIHHSYGFPGTFQVFRLDFSAQTAKWMKMEKLENSALFVSLDRRNPTFSCTNPERWGGKSNCIYVAKPSEDSDEPWTAVELGQPIPGATHCVPYSHPLLRTEGHCSQLEYLWVLPSFINGVDQ
ncbi:hypothetical protein OsI_21340 [Oryza sativa Indica Group]|uniref:KIB1-4 beta-propeller domain-containing protein n=1 Tax=Oryza sativa subsp. indica TaxID=39946 RepID=B8B1K0_ORYSI|nr:hypothetical protein OsI_21340 [Oryza sativa Indica Group]